MSLLRFITGISWWVWTTMLSAAMLMLVVGLGWFPLFTVIIAWTFAVLSRDDECVSRDDDGSADSSEVANVTGLAGAPPHVTQAAVAHASNEQLCEMWQRSGAELRRAYLPATITAHANLRQMVLDEMQRRDPEAVDRWLADQPDRRDPRTYLGSS